MRKILVCGIILLLVGFGGCSESVRIEDCFIGTWSASKELYGEVKEIYTFYSNHSVFASNVGRNKSIYGNWELKDNKLYVSIQDIDYSYNYTFSNDNTILELHNLITGESAFLIKEVI